MRGHPERLIVLAVAAAFAGTLLVPVTGRAAQTCESQIDKAALKYVSTLVKRSVAACKKAPGGTCYNVTVPGIKEKALKKCDTAAIEAQFGGRCVSRDDSCVPAQVASAADVAACLACSIKSDVACLTATAFGATLPAGCVGSPSGAFLDSDTDGGSLFGLPADGGR